MLTPSFLQDINPKHSLEELIHRLYPHELILGDDGQKVVQDALKVKTVIILQTYNINKIITVKPVLSGHCIKRTVAEVPKFISLIYFK